MTGVIAINKPPAWTSHDVVAKIRGLVHEKQIGHLGSLDPLATGVLPLAVGVATRLIEFSAYSKEYLATCLLGKTTDSCDVSGKTLTETPVHLEEEKIRQGVLGLKSLTEQTPPMVSAVKMGGQKLYELARKGVVVERRSRPIQIEDIEVIEVAGPRVTFRVACSAGTYVRVLCQTLGEALGTGGCMETLERTRVGPFLIKDSHSLEEVEKKVNEEKLSDILLPASSLVRHLPELKMEGSMLLDLCQGKKMKLPANPEPGRRDRPPGFYRILNPRGLLCSIAEISPEGELKPKKVFGAEGIH